ncbi:penicillin-binding transpeptidase domain-containing protein [Arthrobacter sp. RAF14]|uniref:penicillin-binding transpeptidase domain-containing protein n=1 Tax=Arthrobacter sp. RAF14 TaxID=3233051 RepID=UPI003F8E9D4D
MTLVGKSTKTLSVLAASVILLGSLSACDDGRKGAESYAQQLAGGLSGLSVGSIRFDGVDGAEADKKLKAIVKGLPDNKPAVKVDAVTVDGDKGTAKLSFDWTLSGAHWSYSTEAALKKSNGEWAAQWVPALVAPELKDDEVLETARQAAPRADILGAGGKVLVTNRPVVNLGIDKSRLNGKDAGASAEQVARLADVDPGGFAAQVKAAGPQAFVSAITLRADSAEAKALTSEKLAQIPGARTVPGTLPLAPSRGFARAVLGTVGEVTAEQVEKSKGALKAGDVAGQGGLQARYDAQLRGQEGVVVRAKASAPASGSTTENPGQDEGRVLFQIAAKAGAPLKTTLDPRLQSLAEDTLKDIAPASAIVALRPSDGAVLASASGPGSNGYNTAMIGQYAPGSTFKIVDSLAMIRNGMTPDSTVSCTATASVDGRTFKNAPLYPASEVGSIQLRDAFAHSCNTAFINARDKVSQAQLSAAAQSLGVGLPSDSLAFDGYLGNVPSSAEGTEHAASMIGQGKVLLSPLAAAVMAGSVGKGAPVTPKLVLNSDAPEPAPGATASSSPSPSASAAPIEKPITAAESTKLKDLMRAVVTSGHAGFLADVPGAPVGAKTGTAEFGMDNPPKTHAWIVATHGDLAVAVFVEDGGLGADTSGPLLKKFLVGAAG